MFDFAWTNRAAKLEKALTSQLQGDPREVDIMQWLSRTSLEMVGKGGLGYSFDALLEEKPNAFGDAIKSFMYVA